MLYHTEIYCDNLLLYWEFQKDFSLHISEVKVIKYALTYN